MLTIEEEEFHFEFHFGKKDRMSREHITGEVFKQIMEGDNQMKDDDYTFALQEIEGFVKKLNVQCENLGSFKIIYVKESDSKFKLKLN